MNMDVHDRVGAVNIFTAQTSTDGIEGTMLKKISKICNLGDGRRGARDTKGHLSNEGDYCVLRVEPLVFPSPYSLEGLSVLTYFKPERAGDRHQ